MKFLFTLALSLFVFSIQLFAQTGTIRGNVYDEKTGEPIIYATVAIEGTDLGANTDFDGFFSIVDVPLGSQVLLISYVGYEEIRDTVNIRESKAAYKAYQLQSGGVVLKEISVSGRREQAKTEVKVSKVTVTPKQIRSLPSTGGVADIAQYLPVLPGIISTGDQGGQLYIRGGSPIQNKILLDGLTIYNPFHSIGFFSVFETETVRSIDVLTGAFNAEHGGRISAVVDIKTREGNKKRLSGLVGVNPFQTNVLVEGPIIKQKDNGGSTSFMLTTKQSYLDETSKVLYSYATPNGDSLGLPFSFQDYYGKLSVISKNGSRFDPFGFSFNDRVNFGGVADVNWKTTGGGASFKLIPPSSNLVIDGNFGFSNYDIAIQEGDEDPRESGLASYNANLGFTYFGNKNQINYGFEFTGFNTDFKFRNFQNQEITQTDFNTELAGYLKYRQQIGDLILEPGIRVQMYASQNATRFEPRFGAKYNATERLRFKTAAGLYSQNLISSVNERDVVNLFVGFLAGPEERIFEPGTREETSDRLQKSAHAILGFEYDLTDNIEINIEGYYKDFSQLININRNKQTANDPNFAKETGFARGVDFTIRYQKSGLYLWGTYSLGQVTRNDGIQEYPTVFDRRHNVNALASYGFGEKNEWEASLRWNFGTGFPFTETQGFYGAQDFDNGLGTDFITENPELGILFSDQRNGGRLPYYHRLDMSVKRTFTFTENMNLELTASVTNAYDRENIFYFDRVSRNRINQLPILPSLGGIFRW